MWALVVGVVQSPALGQSLPPRTNLKSLFAVVGRMHNIDPVLLEAIAEVESGGNPDSVSPKGALGLMQLMPATADQFSVPDPFDPVSNVLGAANFIDYLRDSIDIGPGSSGLPELLAAYNAGPRAVEKFGGIPPYPETRNYVHRVLTRYGQKFSPQPPAPVRKVLAKYRSRYLSASPVSMAGPRSVDGSFVIVGEPQLPALANGGSDGLVLEQLSEIRRLRAQFQRRVRHGPPGSEFGKASAEGLD
jgi:hypothetical protein